MDNLEKKTILGASYKNEDKKELRRKQQRWAPDIPSKTPWVNPRVYKG